MIIGTTHGCQRGKSFLLHAGYQSKSDYLALPDILKTSFTFQNETYNAHHSAPATFHVWLLSLADEWDFENVDTSYWQTHHRWRVINSLLKDGTLRLSEAADGYKLELPEDRSSQSEEKTSEIIQLPEVQVSELRDDIDQLIEELKKRSQSEQKEFGNE